MGVDVRQTNLDVGDAIGIRRRLGFGQQRRPLGIGIEHPVDEALVSTRRLLSHITDARSPRHRDAAVVGIEIACDELQQGRLAGSVATHEADLVPRRDARGRRIEDALSLDVKRQVVDVQHGHTA